MPPKTIPAHSMHTGNNKWPKQFGKGCINPFFPRCDEGDPHLIQCSLGPQQDSTQTACRMSDRQTYARIICRKSPHLTQRKHYNAFKRCVRNMPRLLWTCHKSGVHCSRTVSGQGDRQTESSTDTGWWQGVMVNSAGLINEVNQHQDQLVGRVTIFR